MKLGLAALFFVGSQAFALSFSADCNQEIRVEAVRKAAELGFERVNRHDTPYTFGFSITDRTDAMFCPSQSSKDEVTVGAVITASAWSEEGDQGLMVSECFVRLERVEKDWEAVALTCEDFGIEEQF